MNKFTWALLAFTITFCAPALVIQSFECYANIGSKIGEKVFNLTHADVLN